MHTLSLSLGSLTTRSQEWKSYLVYAEVVNVEKRVANKNACPVVEGRAVVEVTAEANDKRAQSLARQIGSS